MDSKYLTELVNVKTLPDALQYRLEQGFKAEGKGKIGHAVKSYYKILQLILTKDEFRYYYQLENDVTKRIKYLEDMSMESTSATTFDSSMVMGSPRSAEEDESSEMHGGKLLWFSEQKEVMYFSRFSAPAIKIESENEFVSRGHRDYEKLDPLYRQCIRLIMIPLNEPPPFHTSDCLNELRTTFCVSKSFHSEKRNIEEEYTSKYAIYLLNQNEKNLRNNRYYTPEAFNNDEAYNHWIFSQADRLKFLKSKLANISPPETSPFTEPEVDNVTGFPIFSRLISSILVHQWGISFKPDSLDFIREKLIEIYEHSVDDGPIQEHACFINIIDDNPSPATSAFLLSSPFTSWLISEYRSRYGITDIYYYLSVVDNLTQHFKHTIHHILLTNYYLDKAYHFFSENNHYAEIDLNFFKNCVKKLYSLLMQDYLNNILRIFPDEDNTLLLEIDLKLLALILECSQIGNMKARLTMEIVMKKAIKKSIRNYYRENFYNLKNSKDYDLDVFSGVNDSHVAICNGQWLTPIQFYASILTFEQAIEQMDIYEDVLYFAGIELASTASNLFSEYFLDDLKYYIKNQDLHPPPRAILEVGLLYKQKLMHDKEINLDRLFSSFKDQWITTLPSLYTDKLKNWTKLDTWNVSDDLISSSLTKLLDLMNLDFEFCKNVDLLFDNREKLFVQEKLAETHSKAILLYIEQIYNLFVQQFPQEQHGYLNQVFISGIIGRHNTQMSSSTSRKKTREISRKKSQAEININVIDMKIEFWNTTTYHIKRFEKYKKTRPKIMILESMCFKINNMYFLSTRIKRFLKVQDKNSTRDTIAFAKKISKVLLSLFESSLLIYIQEELSYLFKRSKKRISDKIYDFINGMVSYLDNQFEQVSIYVIPKISPNFFKSLWISLFKHLSYINSMTRFTNSQGELLEHLVDQFRILFENYYDVESIQEDVHLFLNLGIGKEKEPKAKRKSGRGSNKNPLPTRSKSINNNLYSERATKIGDVSFSSSSDQFDLDKSYHSTSDENPRVLKRASNSFNNSQRKSKKNTRAKLEQIDSDSDELFDSLAPESISDEKKLRRKPTERPSKFLKITAEISNKYTDDNHHSKKLNILPPEQIGDSPRSNLTSSSRFISRGIFERSKAFLQDQEPSIPPRSTETFTTVEDTHDLSVRSKKSNTENQELPKKILGPGNTVMTVETEKSKKRAKSRRSQKETNDLHSTQKFISSENNGKSKLKEHPNNTEKRKKFVSSENSEHRKIIQIRDQDNSKLTLPKVSYSGSDISAKKGSKKLDPVSETESKSQREYAFISESDSKVSMASTTDKTAGKSKRRKKKKSKTTETRHRKSTNFEDFSQSASASRDVIEPPESVRRTVSYGDNIGAITIERKRSSKKSKMSRIETIPSGDAVEPSSSSNTKVLSKKSASRRSRSSVKKKSKSDSKKKVVRYSSTSRAQKIRKSQSKSTLDPSVKFSLSAKDKRARSSDDLKSNKKRKSKKKGK